MMLPVVFLLPSSAAFGTTFVAGAVLISSLPALIFFYYSMRIFFASRGRPSPGQKVFSLEPVYSDQRLTRVLLLRFGALGLLPMVLVLLSGVWPLFLVPPVLALLTRSSSYPADCLLGITITEKD